MWTVKPTNGANGAPKNATITTTLHSSNESRCNAHERITSHGQKFGDRVHLLIAHFTCVSVCFCCCCQCVQEQACFLRAHVKWKSIKTERTFHRQSQESIWLNMTSWIWCFVFVCVWKRERERERKMWIVCSPVRLFLFWFFLPPQIRRIVIEKAHNASQHIQHIYTDTQHVCMHTHTATHPPHNMYESDRRLRTNTLALNLRSPISTYTARHKHARSKECLSFQFLSWL